jgi:hypothetical protein
MQRVYLRLESRLDYYFTGRLELNLVGRLALNVDMFFAALNKSTYTATADDPYLELL